MTPHAPSPAAPRVVLADNAGLFALGGTRSYVLGRRRVAVVDPGPHAADHLAALEAEVADAEEGAILLTHAHPDHAGGARALAGRTGLPVRRRVPAGGWGEGSAGVAAAPSKSGLADGEEIVTDEGTLRVVATPGHSRDHTAFLLVERRELLAGDLFLGEGDTTWVGEYPGCVEDYLASLDRVEALGLRRILVAHGPPLEDPAEAIRRYRRHRLERVRQVRSALRKWRASPSAGEPGGDDGEGLVEALVAEVYGEGLAPPLREAAAWSVRAILHHLGELSFPEGAPTEGGDGLTAEK